MRSSFALQFGGADLGGLGSGVLGGRFSHLGHLILLFLESLDFASLDSVDFRIVEFLTLIRGFLLLALDIGEVHADDGLLDTHGLAAALLVGLVNTDFLVKASPCGGPGKLNSLLLLVVHLAGLVGDEEVQTAILSNEPTANTGVDSPFGERASVGVSYHF
jgi:hypothetical protein